VRHVLIDNSNDDATRGDEKRKTGKRGELTLKFSILRNNYGTFSVTLRH
jgi:hypothetical protein